MWSEIKLGGLIKKKQNKISKVLSYATCRKAPPFEKKAGQSCHLPGKQVSRIFYIAHVVCLVGGP